jgi:hypothetical protein
MKVTASRPLAPPLYLFVGLSLINALLYALVLCAPYPLAEGLAHPRAPSAILAGFSWGAGLTLIWGYALLTGYYTFALHVATPVAPQHQRT